MVLCYDGSYEGLLTAIFEVYRLQLGEGVVIASEVSYQVGLFETPLAIETDTEKASRVRKGLEGLKGGIAARLLRCFLSEDSARESIILHLMRRAFAEGPDIIDDLRDNKVLRASQLHKKMEREIHRMHAFVRFQQTPDDLYVALIEPDFDVLPLIGTHFEDRYASQDWLIYDTRRHYGLFWESDKQCIEYVTFLAGEHQNRRRLDQDMLAERESGYQSLWQTYFKATDIPERRNMKLHLQHVPRRYWKYLVEKWDTELVSPSTNKLL